MVSKTAILAIRIISDTKKAQAGFKETQTRLDKFQNGLKKLVKPAALAAGAVAKFGLSSIDAAKKLQLSTYAVNHFFGNYADQIRDFAQRGPAAMGMTTAATQKAALQMGMALTNAGFSLGEAANKTEFLMKKAADLGIVLGGDTDRAIFALQAALNGSFVPLDAFGIRIRQADVDARLAAQGLDHLEGEARRTAEATARLELITEGAANAYGLFEAELKTAAVQHRVMTKELEDARAELGMKLLPYVTQFYQLLRQGIAWVSDNSDAVFTWGKRIGIASTAILALNAGLNAYRKVAKAVAAIKKTQVAWQQAVTMATYADVAATGKKSAMDKAAMLVIGKKTLATQNFALAQKKANIAMKLNPIGLIITAIVALIAAIVLLVKNWDTVRDALIRGATAVRGFFIRAWNLIRDTAQRAFAAIADWVTDRLDSIMAIGNAVKETFVWIWEVIKWTAEMVFKAIMYLIGDRLDPVIAKALEVRDFFLAAWNLIKDTAQRTFDAILNWVTARLETIMAIAGAVREFFLGVWNAIRNAATPVFQAIADWISARLDNIMAAAGAVRDFFQAVWNAIRDAAYLAFDRVREAVDRRLAPVRTAIDGVRSAFDSVVDVIRSVIDWLGRVRFPSPPAWMQNLLGGRSLPSPDIPLPDRATRSDFAAVNSAPGARFATNSAPIYAGQPANVFNISISGFVGNEYELGRELTSVLSKYARHTGMRTQGQSLLGIGA